MTIGLEPPKVFKQAPLHYAPVTIVEGEQKGGKTCFLVTRVVDATYKYLTSIKLDNGTPEGLIVKAAPARASGFPVFNSKGEWLVNVWMPDAKLPKIMSVPSRSILIADGVRIFANFHLKGVRYKYVDEKEIVAHLNDGTITGISPDGSVKIAFLLIDEAYLAGLDKRRSLSGLAVTMSHLGYQFAKRHLNVMIALPDANVLGFRITGIESEHVICSYDEFREEITAQIRARKKYKSPRPITFKARLYWKYYDPDEIKQMSNNELASAIAAVS